MSDFYQSGVITTLHRLGKPSLERLEGELLQFSRIRPIALVLPALYSEFEGPAMPGIGFPWGQVLGIPRIAASRSSTRGESECSRRWASSWASVQSRPRTSVSQRSIMQ